jgi:outer membrane protein assembly factor BamB
MPNWFPPFRTRRVTRESSPTSSTAIPSSPERFGRIGFRILVAALAVLALLAMAGCRPNLGASTQGWGAITVDQGVVYATTLNGQVFALNDRGVDGVSTRWTSTVGGEDGFLGSYNPPAVGQYLYVAGIDGFLYALDARESGVVETVWRNPSVESEDMAPLVGSPGLDEARGIVAVGSEDGGLYAYNAITGLALSWSPFRPETEGEVWSTPVLRNGVAYFGSQSGVIYALSLETGVPIWEFQTGGAVVAEPLIHDNMLIVGSFDRQLYALGLDHGDLRWQFQGDNWWWATPVSSGRLILAPSMDGSVYALDENGALRWQHDTGAPIVADPVLLERGLAVANVDGKLSVLRATETDHGSSQEIASLTLGDGEIKAPLISRRDPVTDGTGRPSSVYIGSDDGTVRRVQVVSGINILWCYNTKENNRCN